MTRTKRRQVTLRGDQLLARGDLIEIRDGGSLVKCRVLSCLGIPGEGFVAALEILEGERAGERLTARLKPGGSPDAAESAGGSNADAQSKE